MRRSGLLPMKRAHSLFVGAVFLPASMPRRSVMVSQTSRVAFPVVMVRNCGCLVTTRS